MEIQNIWIKYTESENESRKHPTLGSLCYTKWNDSMLNVTSCLCISVRMVGLPQVLYLNIQFETKELLDITQSVVKFAIKTNKYQYFKFKRTL